MRTMTSTQESAIQFKIPWDKLTARSFFMAIVITGLMLMLLFSVLDFRAEARKSRRVKSVPIELVLGLGPIVGPGAKGNAAREGASKRGSTKPNPLEDAQKTSTVKTRKDVPVQTKQNAYPRPVADVATKQPSKDDSSDAPRGHRDIGTNEGSGKARGLGDFGSGVGRGSGFGEIEWGSGGNRVVVNKQLPRYPRGVNRNTEIRVKFFVEPNGSVSKVLPVRKGEPALEREAVRALKQWKFNPKSGDDQMVGYITFTFQVQ